MSQRVEIVVPSVGPPAVEITVWFAEPGDRIYAGDRLVEVLSGGATFDIPAPATGQLIERTAFAHDKVTPGQIIGAVTADPE
ncbi:MAG: biotin/lipoyl-containing protein [Gemmataceae bacterium]